MELRLSRGRLATFMVMTLIIMFTMGLTFIPWLAFVALVLGWAMRDRASARRRLSTP